MFLIEKRKRRNHVFAFSAVTKLCVYNYLYVYYASRSSHFIKSMHNTLYRQKGKLASKRSNINLDGLARLLRWCRTDKKGHMSTDDDVELNVLGCWVDILGTNCDQCVSMVQCCFMSTETVRLIRTGSPGRPPRLSHSSWTLIWAQVRWWFKLSSYQRKSPIK